MASPPSSTLLLLASAIAAIPIAFGINAILRPAHALSFFEFDYPSTPGPEQTLIDQLMIIYGARDIFMGLAMVICAFSGSKKALGWSLLATSAVAGVDGLVCWGNGHGEWNHWSYAPVLAVGGSLLAGALV